LNGRLYRYLGNTGLKVSVLAYGNMLAEESEEDYAFMRDSIKKCLEGGINFYDNAEVYGAGICETYMGRAFQELKVPREKIVISTKVFMCGQGVNDCFLSRKHIMEGINNSLKRL
jgi:aryl-alcohol dehydrogenase-like predicted oxidoreductase